MDIKVKKRLLWAFLFSICFMVFLLTRVEWDHFRFIAGRLDLKYFIAAFLVFLLGNLLRTLRFVQLDHTDKKLAHWWNINACYNFLTATLPGGAGEAATVYVLKRFSAFNILGALRILLLSRFMDLSALSVLFFLAAVRISSATPYREAAIWLTGVLFIMTSFVLVPSSERFVLRLLQRLPRNILLIKELSEKLNELLLIAKEKRSASFYVVTLTQSVVSISTGIVMLYLLLQSFGINFTFAQSAYCFGVYAIFQIVPVQGIAGIGTQAAWWALALNTAGYKALDAIAMGFVLHGTLYLFITLLGLSALLILFVRRDTK